MRDQWYGDKRDVVKWGTLIALAKKAGAGRILQVAYYRPSRLLYELNSSQQGSISIDPAVVNHFHDIEDIKRLETSSGIQIEVYKDAFQWDQRYYSTDEFREHYHGAVEEHLSSFSSKQVVLLDPDTGIAPQNAQYEHVKGEEIQMIYQALRPGDILAFYQHARMMNRGWLDETLTEFAAALNKSPQDVEVITGDKIANDVAFFVVHN